MDDLPKLWMERQRASMDALEKGIGGGSEFLRFDLRPWDEWEYEADLVRPHIGPGRRLSWPPSDREFKWPEDQFGNYQRPYGNEFDIRSLLAFGQLPTIASFVDIKSEESARIIGYQTYSLVNWRRWGQQVYVLDPDTFRVLAETPLPKFPAHFLRPPVPSFYLVFPHDALRISVAVDPVPQPLEGVFVTFNESEPDPHRSREIVVFGAGKSPKNDPDDDSIVFNTIGLGPDADISTIRCRSYQELSEHVGLDYTQMAEIVPRVIFGFMLYMMSEHPSIRPVPPAKREDTRKIQNPTKKRKAEQRNARKSSLGYLYVGGEQAHKDIVRDIKRGVERGPLAEGHYRRGHMRWQRHGPKYSMVKHIYIREQWVGPDAADTLRVKKIQPAERVDE